MNITSIKLTNRQTNENCFGVSQNILLQYFTNPEILLYQRHRRNLQKVARRTGCYGTEMLHFWDKFTTQNNVFLSELSVFLLTGAESREITNLNHS